MFDFNAFRQMKKSAILINVARGPIVVEDDLYRALEEGEIQAAGLDVFESEPLPKSSKLFNVLNRDRLIMTPHTAWGSVEARSRLIEEIRLNIKAFLDGEERSRIV
jgi:glycerate dehydrogenase